MHDSYFVHMGNHNRGCLGPIDDPDKDGIGYCHKCKRLVTRCNLVPAKIPKNFGPED